MVCGVVYIWGDGRTLPTFLYSRSANEATTYGIWCMFEYGIKGVSGLHEIGIKGVRGMREYGIYGDFGIIGKVIVKVENCEEME